MTLTDRYILATIQSLPLDSQADVRAELSTSIDDAVQALVEAGTSPAEAEREVLTELGDPGVLAASYADRPLHLIGPRYYLAWWRLLKLLLIIVPVTVVGAVALGKSLAGDPVGEVFGHSIGTGFTVAVHLCFWVTLVFAIMERSGDETSLTTWSLDRLPEPAEGTTGRAELVIWIGMLVLGAAAIVWDHARGFVIIDNETFSVLDPNLWPWAIGGLFVLIALQIVFAVVLYTQRTWTSQLAVANTVLETLFVSWTVTLLVRGDLVNVDLLHTAFVTNAVEPEVLRILGVLLGFIVAGIAVMDIVDGWRKALRAERERSISVT